MGDETDYDCAFWPLSSIYQQILAANHIEPIAERGWGHASAKPDFFLLLGMPAESIEIHVEQHAEETIFDNRGTCVPHVVDPLEHAPAEFAHKRSPRIYGKLRPAPDGSSDPPLRSIKGMSGGPLFAFKKRLDGEWEYWLAGIQSSWLPEQRIIAACPILPLAVTFGRAVDQLLLLPVERGTDNGYR